MRVVHVSQSYVGQVEVATRPANQWTSPGEATHNRERLSPTSGNKRKAKGEVPSGRFGGWPRDRSTGKGWRTMQTTAVPQLKLFLGSKSCRSHGRRRCRCSWLVAGHKNNVLWDLSMCGTSHVGPADAAGAAAFVLAILGTFVGMLVGSLIT
ncbi:hypothetical protein B0T22DRAFT_203942 [Podospora appendiculata]|uniref:Uncharacterized protein n=1 Tax=Podospora appendiculata TaxID=314037 RepID=A0AAE0X4I9_9PEZI|nr:hypothetical protein B0T22DRAFT_203942 [Podospora appendiculata]